MEWTILIVSIAILDFFGFNKSGSRTEKNRHKNTKTKSSSSNKNNVEAEITNRNLRIRDIGFYGPYQSSENKIFIIACQDWDYKGGRRGGFREDGMGRIIFLKEKKLCWVKDFERPHDAKVSNEGFVAVNDWLFGEGLKGKFYILTPTGNIHIEDNFSANLGKLGITPDSKLAWTTTAGSNNSDSNQLAVYDAKKGEKLFQRDKLYGEVKKAVHQEDKIKLKTDRNILYEFDSKGIFLNKDEVKRQIEKHKLNSNNYWEVNSLVREKINEFESNDFDNEEVLELIQALEKLDSNIENNYLAKTFRKMGELKLLINKKEEALSDFEKALDLDSKVGIKRKTKKLRKELGL
jgi:hypothetical protein